MAYQIL